MSRECHRKERYFIDITVDKNTVQLPAPIEFIRWMKITKVFYENPEHAGLLILNMPGFPRGHYMVKDKKGKVTPKPYTCMILIDDVFDDNNYGEYSSPDVNDIDWQSSDYNNTSTIDKIEINPYMTDCKLKDLKLRIEIEFGLAA